jgi:hypothetical protein
VNMEILHLAKGWHAAMLQNPSFLLLITTETEGWLAENAPKKPFSTP